MQALVRPALRRPPPSRRAGGFTLLEIMVVMGIIALILGIVANKMAGASTDGQRKATRIQIEGLAGKIDTYQLENGYPSRLEDLLTKPGNAKNWAGPYIKEAELKDPWGNPLVYKRPSTHGNAFDVYSFGPDGKEGGEGKDADIGNW